MVDIKIDSIDEFPLAGSFGPLEFIMKRMDKIEERIRAIEVHIDSMEKAIDNVHKG